MAHGQLLVADDVLDVRPVALGEGPLKLHLVLGGKVAAIAGATQRLGDGPIIDGPLRIVRLPAQRLSVRSSAWNQSWP